MLKVGVTGGIGSGKSTVCRIFETLGIPVYYADDRAKWLMVNNERLKENIKALFGTEAYLPDGSLNRALIAQRAFNDPAQLKALNQLVHPAVFEDGEEWNEEQRKKGAPYTLKEAALIFESKSHLALDLVITVTAPEETRIARVIARDHTTREAVLARIAKQMPESEKVERADFVIQNDGNTPLIQQVMNLHRKLLHAQIQK